MVTKGTFVLYKSNKFFIIWEKYGNKLDILKVKKI